MVRKCLTRLQECSFQHSQGMVHTGTERPQNLSITYKVEFIMLLLYSLKHASIIL